MARHSRRIPAIRRRSGNPYFNRSRRSVGPELPSLRTVSLAAGWVIGLAVFYYLIWGSPFAIREIGITGASPDTERSIRRIIDEQLEGGGIFPSRNIVFFDEDRAISRIGQDFLLESLDIRKTLPGSLAMTVTEKTVRGALLADGRFLGLDGSGFVVRELTDGEAASLGPLPPEYEQVLAPELGAETAFVSDAEAVGEGQDEKESGTPTENRPSLPLILLDPTPNDKGTVQVGGHPVPAPVMSLITVAFEKMAVRVGESPIRFVSRGPDTESAEMLMESGWKAYFGSDQPFDSQIDRLVMILRDKVGERRPELEYVDLRYGERIFFKFRDADSGSG